MKFHVIVTMMVICTFSQINAYPVTMKEAAEGLVKVFGGLSFKKRMNELFDPGMGLTNVNKFLKSMQDTFQYFGSGEETVHRVMKMLDHCEDEPMGFVSIDYSQQFASCAPSTIEVEPTPSIFKPDNFTHEELWNTWLRSKPGLLLSVTPLSEYPGWGHRMWYGLLLLNLLKIRCYSGDKTLKELWHSIPEPSPTEAFENFTLKSLWYTQKPPKIISLSSGEKNLVSATQEMWNNIHYQLLFLHIVHAKCEYQDGLSTRWRRLLPTDNMQLSDDTAKELWDELTNPTRGPKNDDIGKKLADKLYSPVIAQWNLAFSMFGDLNSIDGIFY